MSEFLRDPTNPGAFFPVYSPQDIAEHTFRRHVAVLLLKMLATTGVQPETAPELQALLYMYQVAGSAPPERT